jgi:hypothetical protein
LHVRHQSQFNRSDLFASCNHLHFQLLHFRILSVAGFAGVSASGLSSSSNSSRFALRSVTKKLMPGALLLGRLRLAVTASLPAEHAIGMVAVAAYPQKSLS